MRTIKSSPSHKEKAKAAKTKAASLGEDIDIEAFGAEAEEQPYQNDPSKRNR